MATATNIQTRDWRDGESYHGWHSGQNVIAGYGYNKQNWVACIKFTIESYASALTFNIPCGNMRGVYYTLKYKLHTVDADSAYINATAATAGDGTVTLSKYDFTPVTLTHDYGLLHPGTYYLYLWTSMEAGVNCYSVISHLANGLAVSYTEVAPASELTVNKGTLGTKQTLTVTQYDSSLPHTLTYKCGSASGTICTKSSETSIEWTPPLDLARQNTSGTSVSVTFTLETFSGSTSIGTKSLTVVMAIPDSVKPSINLDLSDDMGYANTYGAFVKGLSKLKVVVNPVLAYGSEIVSYTVTVNGSTYNKASFVTDVLKYYGTLSVKATVTDKRGRSATKTETITSLNYIAPAVSSLTATRCNADGTANEQGEYLKVTFSATITALNNKNAATYTLAYKKSGADDETSIPLTTLEGTYVVKNTTYVFAADNTPYDIIVTAADNFDSYPRSTTGPAALFLMAPNEDGTSMGIGMLPVHEKALDLGFDIHMNGKTIYGMFPVGAVYAEANNEDPTSKFGGTWELVNSTAVTGVYFWKRIL